MIFFLFNFHQVLIVEGTGGGLRRLSFGRSNRNRGVDDDESNVPQTTDSFRRIASNRSYGNLMEKDKIYLLGKDLAHHSNR